MLPAIIFLTLLELCKSIMNVSVRKTTCAPVSDDKGGCVAFYRIPMINAAPSDLQSISKSLGHIELKLGRFIYLCWNF